MDSSLKPVLIRQILVIGGSLGTGLVVAYFFGLIAGLAANMAVLLGIIFYMRRRQLQAMRAFGFGSETAGRGYAGGGTGLRYVCLSCGDEVRGSSCRSCGSKMKKPLF